MLDSNMLLQNATISATGAGTAKDMGADLTPNTYMLYLPTAGTNITVTIEESDDNSTWRTLGTFGNDGGATSITAAGQYYITLQSNARYRRINTTACTGSWTSAVVGIVPAGRDKSW